MNSYELAGFKKAAQENGLNEKQIKDLLKLAEPGNTGAAPASMVSDPSGADASIPPDAAPVMPAPEEAPAAGVEDPSSQIEELFAQLPPEAQQQLLAELAHAKQGGAPAPEAAPAPEGAEEATPELAQAIHEHLNSPEGQPAGGDSPELGTLKSAEYIEAFLNRGVEAGLSIKEACDTYEYALNVSRDIVKQASVEKHASFEKLSAEDHYIQGMLEQAMDCGLNEKQAMDLVSEILNK